MQEFILGEVANDFRHRFMTRLSKKAKENSWKSEKVRVWTNEAQDAFYFSQDVKFNTGSVCLGVYRDINDVLKTLNTDLFDFEYKTVKTGKHGDEGSLEQGYEIHIENISMKKGAKNV